MINVIDISYILTLTFYHRSQILLKPVHRRNIWNNAGRQKEADPHIAQTVQMRPALTRGWHRSAPRCSLPPVTSSKCMKFEDLEYF